MNPGGLGGILIFTISPTQNDGISFPGLFLIGMPERNLCGFSFPEIILDMEGGALYRKAALVFFLFLFFFFLFWSVKRQFVSIPDQRGLPAVSSLVGTAGCCHFLLDTAKPKLGTAIFPCLIQPGRSTGTDFGKWNSWPQAWNFCHAISCLLFFPRQKYCHFFHQFN